MENAPIDGNTRQGLLAVSSADGTTGVALYADPTTHRLLVDSASGSGTVTSVSVTTANGVSGSVATATTTPAITLTLGAITPTSVTSATLTSPTGSNLSIAAANGSSSAGKVLNFTGGTGSAGFAGGDLNFTAGAGNGAGGGSAYLFGGTGGSTSDGGGATLKGGQAGSTSGNAGDAFILGGVVNNNTGLGGNVHIRGASGGGTNNTGGSVILRGGAKTGSGTNGSVRIMNVATTAYALLDVETSLTANRTFTFPDTTGTFGVVTAGGAIIASGVYTPTRSAEANMDSNVTMTEAQYMRVGNTVTVSGRFTADPTLAATATSFEITLPVASNLGAAEDAAGTAFCGTIAGMGAAVIGVAANDTAKIQWVSSDVTSQVWSYTFTYQVI